MAFCRPRRLATFIAQAFSHDHFCHAGQHAPEPPHRAALASCRRRTGRCVRSRLLSPDWLSTGVNPRAGPTALEFLNRAGTSMVLHEGQRRHRTDTGNGHQAPADVVVPDDRQHFAMQAGEALPQLLPGGEQQAP